jgi:sulfur carrier protein ThiS
MAIFAKLAKIGSQVKESSLNDGAQVRDLLSSVGESASGTMTINGSTVNESTYLRNGDVVVISNAVKGNVNTVKFIVLGGGNNIREFMYESGATIGSVIDSLNPDEKSVYVNANGTDKYEYNLSGTTSSSVQRSYVLPVGQGEVKIILSQKTKGNEVK